MSKKLTNDEKYARIKAIGDTLTAGVILDAQTNKMVKLNDETKAALRKEQYLLNAELASDNAWGQAGWNFVEGLAWGAAFSIAIWGGALLFVKLAGSGDAGNGNNN